jgi:hypothetical protein
MPEIAGDAGVRHRAWGFPLEGSRLALPRAGAWQCECPGGAGTLPSLRPQESIPRPRCRPPPTLFCLPPQINVLSAPNQHVDDDAGSSDPTPPGFTELPPNLDKASGLAYLDVSLSRLTKLPPLNPLLA